MESATPSFSILESGYKESLKQLDSLKTKIQMRRNEQANTSVSSDRVNVFEQSWVASNQHDEGFKDNVFDEGYADNQDIYDVQLYQKSRNQLAENTFMNSIEKATTLSPDHFDTSNRKAIREVNSVVERSKMMMQMKKEKADAMRKNFEEISLEELRSAPEINKKSKMLNRSLSDMLSWDEVRKAKIEARALEARQEESAAVTGCPVVTKLAQKLRDVDIGNSMSLTHPRNVEDRLLDYEERKKTKLKQMMDEKESEVKRQASASYVAPHSASLQRSGDVADRLYQLASVQQKERLERTEVANNLYAYDSNTGEKLFQPRLNKTTEKIAHNSRPNVRVEDLLHHKGQLYRQNLLAKEKKLESRAQNMRESAKLNPVSQRIVYQRYVLQGETVGDRLSKPIGTVKQRTLQEMQQELTFKPKIGGRNGNDSTQSIFSASASLSSKIRPSTHAFNPPSNHSDYEIGSYSDFYELEEQLQHAVDTDPDAEEYSDSNNNNNNDDRLNSSSVSRCSTPSRSSIYLRSKKWDERRQLKIQRDQQARLQQELQECSFQPRVPSTRDERDREDASRSASIADRNALWAQRREQKLEVGRLQAERDAVVGCSFRPTMHSEQGPRSRSRSTGRTRGASESNVFSGQYGEDEYEYNHDNSFNETANDAPSLSSSRGKIPIPTKNGSHHVRPADENRSNSVSRGIEPHRQQYSEDEDGRFDPASHSRTALTNNSRERSRSQLAHQRHFRNGPAAQSQPQSFLPPEQIQFVDSAMESYSAHLMRMSKGHLNNNTTMSSSSNDNFVLDDSDSLSAAYELEY